MFFPLQRPAKDAQDIGVNGSAVNIVSKNLTHTAFRQMRGAICGRYQVNIDVPTRQCTAFTDAQRVDLRQGLNSAGIAHEGPRTAEKGAANGVGDNYREEQTTGSDAEHDRDNPAIGLFHLGGHKSNV